MEQIKKNDINYFYLENKENACIQYGNCKIKIDIELNKDKRVYYPDIVDAIKQNMSKELLTKKCKLLLNKIEAIKKLSTAIFKEKESIGGFDSSYIKKYYKNLLFSYKKYNNIARRKKKATQRELFFLRFVELNFEALQLYLKKNGHLKCSCPATDYSLTREIDYYYYIIINLYERLTNLFNILLSNEDKELNIENKETIEFLITFKYKFFFLFLNYYGTSKYASVYDYKCVVSNNIMYTLGILDMYFPPTENFKSNNLINFFFRLNNTIFEDRIGKTEYIKEFSFFIKKFCSFGNDMPYEESKKLFIPPSGETFENLVKYKKMYKKSMLDSRIDLVELNRLASFNYIRPFDLRTDFSNVLGVVEQQAMFRNTYLPHFSINNKIEVYYLIQKGDDLLKYENNYALNGVFSEYIITKEVNNMNTCCFTEDMLTFEYIEQVVNVCLEMSHNSFFGEMIEYMTRYKERGRPDMY